MYGGEPLLLFPLIRKTVARWREAFQRAGKEIRLSCTTNGSLLTEEVRWFFDEHDVGALLSLDGPPELHDQTRRLRGGQGTSSLIPHNAILAWRPQIEIAWHVDPRVAFAPEHLDAMIARGFRRIAFNINWGREWDLEACERLTIFFEHAGRRMLAGHFASNWKAKLDKLLTRKDRMAVPCGTGRAMLGLSPEGWLYPSQEMVYTTAQPNRAPGTLEYYRIGDVFRDQVVDADALARVSTIRTDQLRATAGFDCSACFARVACLGGCHCQYAGQDGRDPANRYGVAPGFCQSYRAALNGMLRGKAGFRRGAAAEQSASALPPIASPSASTL